mmetsp:Transcript_7517/g.12400  ORF Transcript_7517/g.12400 Transcript_7517/m.12400 type:complete len:226 (-) Transcript_7517:357-1034(-)
MKYSIILRLSWTSISVELLWQIYSTANQHEADVNYPPSKVKCGRAACYTVCPTEVCQTIFQVGEIEQGRPRFHNFIVMPYKGIHYDRRHQVNEQSCHCVHIMEKACNEWQSYICTRENTAKDPHGTFKHHLSESGIQFKAKDTRNHNVGKGSHGDKVCEPAEIKIVECLIERLRTPHVIKLSWDHIKALNQINQPDMFRVRPQYPTNEKAIQDPDAKVHFIKTFR